jgi:hypothetical protein
LFCWLPDTKGRGGLKYFNVKAFFAAETARLQKNNEPVFKTISYNGGTESKTVKIKNWKQELDFFQSSDINKPAWKNSYAVANYADEIIYRAKDPDLKMREMIVKSENHVVKYIFIFNSAKNILYQTTEKLSYFPDSAYIIEKAQRVALLGASVYKVKGVFKR